MVRLRGFVAFYFLTATFLTKIDHFLKILVRFFQGRGAFRYPRQPFKAQNQVAFLKIDVSLSDIFEHTFFDLSDLILYFQGDF